jgi:8-oxo-dGTP diphosphatase
VSTTTRPVVRAAGGVVWRRRDDKVEVLVVHRPAPRDDWSLPKGKLEEGERHRDAALREVLEETGMRCTLGERLTEISYDTPKGEDKRVRWWAMTVDRDEGFTPNREVDDRRWVPVKDLDRRLSWPTDRDLVRLFLDRGIAS